MCVWIVGGEYADGENREGLLKLSVLSGWIHYKSKLLPSSSEDPGEMRQPDPLTPCNCL